MKLVKVERGIGSQVAAAFERIIDFPVYFDIISTEKSDLIFINGLALIDI